MLKKRKLSSAKDRCRICLVKEGSMTNLFEKSVFTKIRDLIQSTSVKIENDAALPDIICHVCLYKLEMWDEFKEQFKQSHELLTSQLGIAKSTDGMVRAKRTHSDVQCSTEDSLSDILSHKKIKSGVPSLVPLDFTISLSDDEATSSKETGQRINKDSNTEQDSVKLINEENHTEEKPSLVPMKVKSLMGKRSKTTESRRASTKRWVARKKALLAATGKSASDTDSMGSDDAQLSPVQKARARNILDKENLRQKRVARELKKLGATINEEHVTKYDSDNFGCADSESDIRKTRSQKDLNSNSSTRAGNTTVKSSRKTASVVKGTSHDKNTLCVPSQTYTQNYTTEPTEEQLNEKSFAPHLVRSELELGNSTYVITSTLILSEPHYLSENSLSNLTKELRSSVSDQNSQEKNTDIIDAVQLRRVNPILNDVNEKKSSERCLNIEIEGTELDALKCVQVELARFVEKEMKHRLCGINTMDAPNGKPKAVSQNSYQTLDQQLKGIVEKAIKKNFESSTARCSNNDIDTESKVSCTISPTSAKAVEKCKKYQPQVVVKRLDMTHESKYRKINNAHTASRCTIMNKLDSSASTLPQKRQSVLPIRYTDYNTSTIDSGESSVSPEVLESEVTKVESTHNVEVCNTNTPKHTKIINSLREARKSTESVHTTTSLTKIGQGKGTEDMSVKINAATQERHVCGVCGKAFGSREDVTKHFRIHKIDNTSPRNSKHKVMRCKRCHEIVEARFVKAHVCKQIHKCYVCNSTFRTEKLLIRHLEGHDQSEFNIENITKGQYKKPAVATELGKIEAPTEINKVYDVIQNSNNSDINHLNLKPQTEKVPHAKGDRLGSDALKETYICFVCDKVFTDEEELKDHLQKHCDDISENEQSKELYQCAICGDSMSSEDALEAHVEKHLFDEEDDNPNLINIGSENEKPSTDDYHCLQCTEKFNSEMLLEMHMQAHEEEAAIAEWERQEVKSYEFRCMICDDVFNAEEELSEHLDIHYGNAHPCQLCEKPFRTLEDLQKHVATH